MADRSLIVLVAVLLLARGLRAPAHPGAMRSPAMIGLFTKRVWFWEVAFWLLVLELARLIGG